MKLSRLISALLFVLYSGFASAESAYLATSVNIIAISNTAANGKSFGVVVANGNDDKPCENTTINFPLSAAGNAGNDENIHNRAFSLAMLAYTSNKKVTIVTYHDNGTCSGASYIQLL